MTPMRFGSNSRAGRQIFVDRRGVAFGLGDQRHVAEAHALAVAGAVDDQAADAARHQVGNAVAVLDLLGDVEAVEEHDGGRRIGAGRLRIGMHQESRAGCALIGDLDRLDARPAQEGGGIEEGRDGFRDRPPCRGRSSAAGSARRSGSSGSRAGRQDAAVSLWPEASASRPRASTLSPIRVHSSNQASSLPTRSRNARPTRFTSSISAPPHGAPLRQMSRPIDQR